MWRLKAFWEKERARGFLSMYKLVCGCLAALYIMTSNPFEQASDPKVSSQAIQEERGQNERRAETVSVSMFSPPGGMFNPLLYSDVYEANLLQFIFEPLVRLNPEMEWEGALAKEWFYENDDKTLVFTLRDDVYWHDGTPFTAEDVYFTYRLLAHPEYTGVRQSYVRDLAGFTEYHKGDAQEFAGVEVIDQHTVKFHFVRPNVAALYRASSMIIPEHIYGQYEVNSLAKAKESLDFSQLVGTGPFKASTYISNEVYTFVRHEQYWAGAPRISRMVWRVINQDVAPGLLANGELDIITSPGGVRAADYELVASLPHVRLFETPSFGYQYLGFKLNFRPEEDIKLRLVRPEKFIPNQILQSKELRQAIAHGIDRQGMVDGLLKGHGRVQHSPFSSAWPIPALGKEYAYDPKRAKRILTESGFIDRNGDGYREQPDGKELVLRLQYPSGDKVREQTAIVIQRNLQDIGLRIKLYTPRDPSTHYANLEQDQQHIDLFLGGWGLSAADPDPKAIWDRHSLWNFARWDDAYQQELLDQALDDPRSIEQEYRYHLYGKWAAYVQEELPYLFLYAVHDIYAYHQRIKGVIESPLGIFHHVHQWTVDEA